MDGDFLNQIPEPLAGKVREALAELERRNVELVEKNQKLEGRNLALRDWIRLLMLKKYGAKSEGLSDDQLALLELEPGVSIPEVATEAAQADKLTGAASKPRKKPVRAALPAHFPRVERIIKVAAEDCFCKQCGGAKKLIGYEVSERLAIKPVELYVEEIKREKLACAKCEEMGVSVAPVPATIIEKGILADSMVVDVIIKKYCEHNPLYRQAAGILRDAGIEVSQSTLSSSVIKSGELLFGVCAAMKRDLLAGGYIQADETTVPVQSKHTKGKNHRAYFWEYSDPGGTVIYDFQMGRSRECAARFLAGYDGLLQTDGYAAYDKIGAPGIVHFGCWAHARRYFVEASKLDLKDARSVAIVDKIAKLYELEANARDQSLDDAQREALRAIHCPPLLSEINALISAARSLSMPKSALGRACTYALNQWERLTRYAQAGHGRVEIDNNRAENSMRTVALGRRNWIHVGCESAGPKVAALISILETCRRLKINPRHYLQDVLPQLSYRSTRPQLTNLTPLEELTPAAWQRARSKSTETPAQ